jgi:hypothetical protein
VGEWSRRCSSSSLALLWRGCAGVASPTSFSLALHRNGVAPGLSSGAVVARSCTAGGGQLFRYMIEQGVLIEPILWFVRPPAVLWTNGGPGCSGLLGFFTAQAESVRLELGEWPLAHASGCCPCHGEGRAKHLYMESFVARMYCRSAPPPPPRCITAALTRTPCCLLPPCACAYSRGLPAWMLGWGR